MAVPDRFISDIKASIDLPPNYGHSMANVSVYGHRTCSVAIQSCDFVSCSTRFKQGFKRQSHSQSPGVCGVARASIVKTANSFSTCFVLPRRIRGTEVGSKALASKQGKTVNRKQNQFSVWARHGLSPSAQR